MESGVAEDVTAAITVTISYTVEQIAELEAKLDKVIEDPDVPGYNVVFRYYLPKEYTVTTDLNAGNAAVTFEEGKVMPQKHVFNQNTALPIPSRVGYTFQGWVLTVEGVEGEDLLTPGVSIEAKKYDGNITLTARWTPKKYDVTYDWNGKDEANDQAIALLNKTLLEKFATYTYDTPVAFPAPLRSGYSFRGWVISVEGEVLYEGKLFTELPAEMFSMEDPKAVTLTAQWQANTYTVTFNGNGATDGVYPESTTVVFDQPLVLEGLTVPVRFGYVFQGYWSCDSQGFFLKAYVSPQGESLCEIWDIPSDTTLIAKWEKLPEILPPTFKINYIKETIEVEGIRKAEEELQRGAPLYCLGDIVHNGMECERLRHMGLTAINHYALSGRESVLHSQEICPVGYFFRRGPPSKRSLFHYLIPKDRIIHDAVIQGSSHAARIKAVAHSSELRDPQCHILGIGNHTTLAGAILRKLRTCMAAGRSYVQNRLDSWTHTIFLSHLDQRLQVYVNVSLILSAGIVDQYVHIVHLRQLFPYIAYDMSVCCGFD